MKTRSDKCFQFQQKDFSGNKKLFALVSLDEIKNIKFKMTS